METKNINWHGTTIVSVRKGKDVVMVAEGQVPLGKIILKTNVQKVRRLNKGNVIAGFSGSTADALVLFDLLEAKIEENPHQLMRACVDLIKEWRRDVYLRDLDAMMAVVNSQSSLILTSAGEVLEPDDGLIGIGSEGPAALAAVRALIDIKGLSAQEIAEKAINIASATSHGYTKKTLVIESITT